MNQAQWRILRRFERLVRDARRAGLVVVADSNEIAIRLIPTQVRDGAEDIRQLGEMIPVDDGCGSASKISGWIGNYTTI